MLDFLTKVLMKSAVRTKSYPIRAGDDKRLAGAGTSREWAICFAIILSFVTPLPVVIPWGYASIESFTKAFPKVFVLAPLEGFRLSIIVRR